MSVGTTPERVKNLLSSFLASSKQLSKSKSILADIDDSLTKDVSNCSQTTAKALTTNLRSFDSFIERLDTFSSLTWFGKPPELSPLICARYGWANVDTDSLQCVGCKAYLCGKLPDQTDNKAYHVFKEKLKNDILAAHDKFCVLAANPCPESFCLIPCDDPTSLISNFTDRVSALGSVAPSSLPDIDYSTLHSYGYDEGQGAAYCKRLLLPESDTSPEVVALSVTGWTCMPSKTDILMCSNCRRRAGLWNFHTDPSHLVHSNGDSDKEKNGEDKEPESKIPKIQAKSSFNPVEEHKHWCPWLLPTLPSTSAVSTSKSPSVGSKRPRQEEPAQQPAFIVALQTIAPGLMDNNTGLAQAMKVSPVADGLRCFRRVIKTWSSPKRSLPDSSPKKSSSSSPASRTSL